MSEVAKDVSKVWDRIFDQKGFLYGEIIFTLKEFEIKRGDSEVDNLFKSIENITDIKDTQINRLSEVVNEKIVDANQQLSEALKLCSQFADLEEKFIQSPVLEEIRSKRKDEWENVMDDITSQYSKINAEFEDKEIKTTQFYNDLNRKLNLIAQMRMLYKHILAIFQFVASVVTGFIFGLVGIEQIMGSLDFGFRLLLGVICALTIALAELNFLAKKLNENLEFDYSSSNHDTKMK